MLNHGSSSVTFMPAIPDVQSDLPAKQAADPGRALRVENLALICDLFASPLRLHVLEAIVWLFAGDR